MQSLHRSRWVGFMQTYWKEIDLDDICGSEGQGPKSI